MNANRRLWTPGESRPSTGVLKRRFPDVRLGHYAVYRRDDLNHALISKMRGIAVEWGIANATQVREVSRTQVRDAILDHPNNISPVPHPLIRMPVYNGARWRTNP